MKRSRIGSRPRATAVAAAVAAIMMGLGQSPASAAHTTVTAVKGSAFGYHTDNISLFGGAQPDKGPNPTVTLAADASNSPQTATVPSALVQYGPAVLFSSDRIDVTTSGSAGPSGSVTSSTSIQNANKSTTQPTKTGSEILTADNLGSTCTASQSATSGSTTVTGGILQTDSGWNDGDAIYPEPAATAGGLDEHDPVNVALPASPAAGTSYAGHIHLSATSTDYFTVVLNEQITNPDGSLTVNAVHEEFGTDPPGNTSILQGDLILGQAVCGVTVEPGSNQPPEAVDDAYNTTVNTPLTVPAPGVLGNDNDADGGTLTAGSASDPAGGSVTLDPDGSFTYTPDSGFSGTDNFTYTVTDDHGANDTATVSITVAAAPPERTVSISPASVTEGTAPLPNGAKFTIMRFAVTLSSRSPDPVTVTVSTADGTALAPGDYKSRTATVTIPAGKLRTVFKVKIVPDAIDEDDESLTVTLSSPTNAGLGTSTAVGTVVDDEGSTG